MKPMLVLYLVSLFVFQGQSCENKAQNTNSRGAQSQKYTVIRKSCTERQRCLVIAYCPPDFFTKSRMKTVAESLSAEFANTTVVNVDIFDDKEIAKSFSNGKRNLGEIQDLRRGWYVRSPEREFLMFEEGLDKEKQLVTIQLKKEPN